MDDGLFFSPHKEDIVKAVEELKNNGYDLEAQQSVKDYLGINIKRMKDGKIKLSQPHLIDQVVKEVGMSIGKGQSTPAASTVILHRFEHEEDYDEKEFHYRSVIGKLNFIEKSTRPDISYATHQCARFCENPKVSHAKAVKRLVAYLRNSRDEGIVMDPKKERLSLEIYCDADWSGNYVKRTAEWDASTAKSRTGFVICLEEHRYYGNQSSKHKLHSQQQKQSMWSCQRL